MDIKGINDDIALVFDFDGTICRVFKNYDLSKVAVRMSREMRNYGIDFSSEKDVFDVFSEIIAQSSENAQNKEDALNTANDILTVAEVEAVESGDIVKGFVSIMRILQEKGILMGVSTNNSAECVKHFMEMNCPELSLPIVGRVGNKPELMKPNIWSLVEVVKLMRCTHKHIIFIGDSGRDFYCAKDAGVDFIGMAPAEYKRQRLLKLMPESEIVEDFYELYSMLRSRYSKCL